MKIELQTNQYLIQEFMGVDKTKRFVPYHSCWNWLMPVVIKIEEQNELIGAHILSTNIDAVYKAVVKFIKTYNETK